MKSRKPKLVLWAIDPFEVEHFKAQEEAVRTLDRLIDRNSVIQPIFVWSGRPMGEAIKAAQIAEQANLILGKWPKPELEVHTRGLKVLVAGGTTSARAKTLADYAKRVRCDLILTSHHTRSKLKRAFLGSFSESLSLVARSPLLIVPPTLQSFSRKQSILFPTDFSDASMAAFEEIIHLAAISGARLTIFHKMERFPYYPIEFGYTAYSTDLYDAMIEDAEYSLAEMKARASRAGIKVEMLFDKGAGHVGRAIVSRARKDFGLVTMAAHKGFWDRVVMGSTSRYVLRECPTATWIFRPTPKILEKKSKSTRKETSKTPQTSNVYVA